MPTRPQDIVRNVVAEAALALIADVLRRFGSARLRVFGSSMLPAIRPGDVLSVRRAGLDDIRPGDVVLFERDGRLFAHRAIRRRPDGTLKTRGDAHWRSDPPVTASQVLGVARSAARVLRP